MISSLRKLARPWAVVFILANLLNVLAPTISWALTSGPTAPEATSFEPVDTTDMVNLATGQFVYNTPLIEIPGPDGGYPLSLSYHAGIKVDQEASWVGLGWTLNPGALNRTVNSFPDDNISAKRETKDYWGGGEQTTRTYSLGLTIPNSGIGINYSIARTNDTFKGFSTASSFGVSIDPVGIVLKKAAKREALNNGLSGGVGTKSSNLFNLNAYNHLSDFIGGGVNLGFSINSQGIKTNISVAGQSFNQNNLNAGKISSYTIEKDGGSIPLLKFGELSIKDYYTRYWSDENQELVTFGTIYPSVANNYIGEDHYENTYGSSRLVSYAFDKYDLYDGSPDDIGDNDPSKNMGGSLPAYDRFDVMGQGIGGVMQPIIFDNGDLFGQNNYERDPVLGGPLTGYPSLLYKTLRKFPDKKVGFRFLNDFSNSLKIDSPPILSDGTNLSTNSNTVQALEKGFNNSGRNQKLAGSRHVEWFSNQEIVDGDAKTLGFIDCYQNRGDRQLIFNLYDNYLQPEACAPYSGYRTYGTGSGSFTTDKYKDTNLYPPELGPAFKSLKPTPISLGKKIGGFMVTNETGVTYHYGLPVYNSNEYTKTKLKNPFKGAATFTETKNNEPYAYTWLLTAITGPDFVDRNNSGTLDDGDWGYWVKFDYGRWADSYQWRTPHSGYMDDIEGGYQTFSYGIKELYYLDAVETRSHKAIFIKSKRKDGKGVTSRLEGGSNPRQYSMRYNRMGWTDPNRNIDFGFLNFSVSPVSTMKLDAIYLFDKNNLEALAVDKARGEKYNQASTTTPYAYPFRYANGNTSPYEGYGARIAQDEDFIYVKYHNGDLVFDDDDIQNLPTFKQKASRIIEFNTDYSLSTNVPNSIGYLKDILTVSDPSGLCVNNANCDQLDSRIGQDYERPLRQSCIVEYPNGYDCCSVNDLFYSSNPLARYFYNSGISPCTISGSEAAYVGDLVSYFRTGKLTLTGLKIFGHSGTDIIPPTTFSYSINPSYSDKYDEWGYYKSDYNSSIIDHTRKITEASSEDTDAWSLSSINTPIGGSVKIVYEPNTYGQSVYNDFSVFSIAKLEPSNGNNVKATFKEKGLNLSKWFTYGNRVDLKSFIVYDVNNFNSKSVNFESGSSDIVTEIGSDYLLINSPELRNAITRTTITIRERRAGRGRDDPSGYIDVTYNCTPYFITGFFKANDPANLKFTGSIRVKELTMINENFEPNTTLYGYNLPNSVASSGVTSFKPFNEPSIRYPDGIPFFDNMQTNDKKDKQQALNSLRYSFQKIINQPFEKIMMFTREAPAPGSLYSYVTIKHKFNELEGDSYTVHQFLPFDETMVTRQLPPDLSRGNDPDIRQVTIINNAVDVGNALSISTINNQGHKLKMTKFGYLHDSDVKDYELRILEMKQGLIEQSFHKHVNVTEYGYVSLSSGVPLPPNPRYSKIRGLVTKRVDRSNVVTSVEESDYVKGINTITENLSFDFYSGKPNKVLSTDSYGNKYVTESVAAYTIDGYSGMASVQIEAGFSGMGLKVNNPKNRNMLTQESASITFKVNDNYQTDQDNPANKLALVSANAQTWSDQSEVMGVGGNNRAAKQTGIWRMKSSFSFVGDSYSAMSNDGLLPLPNFTPFDAWANNATTTNGWQKNSEVTLYDYNSHAIEAKDINEKFAATKFSFDHAQVFATAANAEYDEIAYSGAEEEPKVDQFGLLAFGGGVYCFGTRTNGMAHTGSYSVGQEPNAPAFKYYFYPNVKNYTVNFWSSAPLAKVKYKIGSNSPVSIDATKVGTAGAWHQMKADIVVTDSSDPMEIWCEASTGFTNFDDFRIHPYQAAMTSYVYNNWGELTHILDNNNLYTEYKYDGMGRLKETFKESFQANTLGVSKISEINYNYGLKNATPFKVTISTEVATNTSGVPQIGGSGVISPTVQVLQGGNATISATNRCDNLTTRFYADGKLLLNTYGSMVTLYDGAKAYIDGGVCKLTGVLGDHTVKAEFEGPGPAPLILHQADCEMDGECYTGMYILSTWRNECGIFVREPGLRIKSQLPDDIRNTVNDCTNSNNSGCSTKERR